MYKKELNYLKYYFGNYLVSCDEETISELKPKFLSNNKVFYLYGKRKDLLKAGFIFLSLDKNYLECKKIRGYDLIETFLNHEELCGLETFYDIEEKNLIIYHLSGTTSNTRLISLIQHVITFRALENKTTLVLSEEDIINELQDSQTNIVNLRENKEDIYDEVC